jgi:hypothetical protein
MGMGMNGGGCGEDSFDRAERMAEIGRLVARVMKGFPLDMAADGVVMLEGEGAPDHGGCACKKKQMMLKSSKPKEEDYEEDAE